MKKEIFLVLVLILLITPVYAFSIKDTLTSFSVMDFFNDLFGIEEKVVGVNIERDVEKIDGSKMPIKKTNRIIKEFDFSDEVIEQPITDVGEVENVDVVTQESVVVEEDSESSGIIIVQDGLDDEILEEEINVGVVPNIHGYLSVATLKDNYLVDEQINLTDPPAEEGFFSKLIVSIKGIFKKNDREEEEIRIFKDVETRDGFGSQIDFIEDGKNFDNFVYGNWTNYSKPVFKGYIIKYKEKSVGERRVELINKKENNIDQNLLDYKYELEGKHQEHDNVLSSRISDYNNKKKFDYKLAFNGVSLDINSYEVSKIKDLDFIESISPNYQVEALLRDSIPIINADDVWDLGYTGEGIKIAIIDTGIDYTHEDLGGCFGVGCRVEGGFDFVNNDSDPIDDAGHGTHVAGTAAGNGIAGDGLPIRGVAPNATLYAYKVLSEGGYGSTDWILASFEYVLDPNQDGNLSDHLDIASLSLGSSGGNPDDEMSFAVDNMVNNGVISVVAAGNSGPYYNTVGSPGTSRKAITVGASTKDDEIAFYSSRGPTSIGTLKPDVVAPGGNLQNIDGNICATRLPGFEPWMYNPTYNLCIDGNHVALAGTSMATPHVAGAAALIKQINPDWTPDEIKYALRNTAIDLGFDMKTQGYGRIDVLNVVRLQNAPTIAEISTSGEVTGIINISGSAFGNGFDYYILYYGYSDDPTQWIELISSDISINGGNLFYNFDTTYFSEEEEYTLRLLVYNQYNESSEDRTFITPNNVELNSPGIMQSEVVIFAYNNYPSMTEYVNNVFLQGDSILINGTVPFGEGIISYDINYANENDQNNWFNEGIVLTNNFGKGIILGSWNNLQDLEEGNYLLKLTVEHINNTYSNITNMLTVSKSQHDSWPLYYTSEEPIGSFVTMADVNPIIGGDELIMGIMGIYPSTPYQMSQVAVRDHEGNLLDGWPQNISFSSWTFPSVGDINGDGYNEIVIASGRGYRSNSKIYAFNYDGSLVGGWPVGVLEDSFYQTTLSDLDRDGDMEVIVASYFDNFTSYNPEWDNGTIYVLDGNGNNLEGWPKSFYKHNAGWHPIAVGDVDNDNDDEEIVAALFDGEHNPYSNFTYASLYVFDKDGNVLEGWPKNVSSFFNNFTQENYDWGLSYNGPTLVDLDGDYDLEIIVTINSEIFIFNHDGEMFGGWPQTIDQIPSTSAVVGDLDLEYPGLEIVFSSAKKLFYENLWAPGTKIYVFHSDGSIMGGWPKEVCHSDEFGLNYVKSTPPIILDINNDGYNEIVSTCDLSMYTTDNDIYVLNRYGNVLEGWPKKVIYGSGFSDGAAQSGFALGDIDNDGMLELTIASVGWYQGYAIYSWDLNITKNVSMPWPMFGHDAQHTNAYPVSRTPLNYTYTLTVNPTSGIAPLVVNFSIEGAVPNGAIYEWNFGDEIITTEPQSNIEYIYENEGNYQSFVNVIYDDEIIAVSNNVTIIVLPKSKIQNTGSLSIQGYLFMKIQKNVSGVWEDYQIVVNDLQTSTLRTIEGNSYLALDLIWNPYNVVISEEGNYRVYAALVNSDGSIIQTSQGYLGDVYYFNVNNLYGVEVIQEINE
ncbi:MAG: S8 family serine peptidase [Nanoarchaeota archaeon]|nr:S8 family serine peptidase [Nanoarchaeota archaeon]